MKSLLERLARERAQGTEHGGVVYSEQRQLSVLADDPHGVAAVLHPKRPLLKTKKGDIEKGEDDKDKWA